MVDTVQDIGRNSGRQVRAGAGRLGGGGGPLGGGSLGGGGGPLGGGPLGGGGGPHGTNDDFWLPKVRHFAAQLYNVDLFEQVSGATGQQGRKGGPQQFHSVVRKGV